MKKIIIFALAVAFVLIAAGCGHVPDHTREDVEVPDGTQEPSPILEAEGNELPEFLPAALASIEDLDGSGGYLLIGEIQEADIALYCDNSESRNTAYIRYGEHFQAFQQKAWMDPAILPELDWRDWDEDGAMELVVKYLRHEGTFFDGEAASPGIVYEEVVYKWDNGQWTDIHFYSGGGPQTPE